MRISLSQLIQNLLILLTLFTYTNLNHAASPYEEGWDHFSSGNYAIAKKIWLPLAEQGDADAALGLAIIYENGLQTRRDQKASTRWYQVAADSGIAEAQHDLGIKYFTGSGVGKDLTRTFELWKQAAETGLGSAQTKLAYLYLRGMGTEQNEQEAVRWYRQAAKQGNPEGMYNLSLMYKRGIGVEANPHQFQYWLNQSAELDYAPAQYDLGLMKLHGKDMEKSVSEGKLWLMKASNNGYVDAQYYLGTLLLNGHILKPDREMATDLLNAAATQGHQAAKQSLIDIRIMQQREKTAKGNDVVLSPSSPSASDEDLTINRSEILDTVVLNESLVKENKPVTKTGQQSVEGKQTGSWLSRQDASAFTIQLLASKDQANIERFLQSIPGAIKTHRYQYSVKGETWTGIATGIYPSIKEANLAIKTLPAALKKNKPWVRSIGALQKLASG
jgi:TPR repeat protein